MHQPLKSPLNPHSSPNKHCENHYVAKVQVAPEEVNIPSLDTKVIKSVQAIVWAVIFYVRAMDNKAVVFLNAIDTQHASAT